MTFNTPEISNFGKTLIDADPCPVVDLRTVLNLVAEFYRAAVQRRMNLILGFQADDGMVILDWGFQISFAGRICRWQNRNQGSSKRVEMHIYLNDLFENV